MSRFAARNSFFAVGGGIDEEMGKKVEKNICGFINYVYFRGLVEKR